MKSVFAEDAGLAATRLFREGKIKHFWVDRVTDLIHEVTWDGNGFSKVGNIKVSPNWPLQGTLRFTRVADNQRFKAYLSGKKYKKWKVPPV